MKRFVCTLLVLLMAVSLLTVPASAEETEPVAQSILDNNIIKDKKGFEKLDRLYDRSWNPVNFLDGTYLELHHPEGIGSVYIIFCKEYGEFTVTDLDSGEVRTFGEHSFLTEFADLEAAFGKAPLNVRLDFRNGPGEIREMYAFTPGEVPDFVHKWKPAKEGETDLILFSTHGDDEHLFFAGLLPYYAKEMGYEVLVCYMTDHRNATTLRVLEMLNGLWAVGVDTYPVLGTFPDRSSTSAEMAAQYFSYEGITEEDLQGFIVENIRRFKPKVAVGHDLYGEYGHGQHMLYAKHLTQAVEITGDPEYFPESAEAYGTWDVPKTYLHLYWENEINLDWDQPMKDFGGLTPFQVSKDLGFPCHTTQYWEFIGYYYGVEKAAEVPLYSPCEYGLYRSTVGPDVQKNDFFENVSTHAQDRIAEEEARLAAEEEAKRLEEERLAAEAEAARREEERLKQEEADRAAEEAQRLQQEAADGEQKQGRELLGWGLSGVLTVLVLLGAVIAIVEQKKKI